VPALGQHKGKGAQLGAPPIQKIIKSDEGEGCFGGSNSVRGKRKRRRHTRALGLMFQKDGKFACVCCDLPLFSSKTKFESHRMAQLWARWPGQTAEKIDNSWMRRGLSAVRPVQCSFGSRFDTRTRPTGLRYCMTGVAMKLSGHDEGIILKYPDCPLPSLSA